MSPCDDSKSWEDEVVSRQKTSEAQEMRQVTIGAVDLRRVALGEEIIEFCGNLGLKHRLLRMDILVKELCSTQER